VAWKGDADDLSLGWSQENNKKGTFTLAAKIAIANLYLRFTANSSAPHQATSQKKKSAVR
jgi:hypothetical protein